MAKGSGRRNGIVESCTRVMNGHFLLIANLEGSPKGRVSMRALRLHVPGERVQMVKAGLSWTLAHEH